MRQYEVEGLSYCRQSPYFEARVSDQRKQLRVADDFLCRTENCVTELLSAMHAAGIASRNLAQCLGSTPAMFQASSVVSALSTVLSELSSAEEVLAESLELAVAKVLSAFRKEMAKFEEMRRASERAETDAVAALELLLHGDWVRVERDIQKQRKVAARRAIQNKSPPPLPFSGHVEIREGDSDYIQKQQGESLASVVEERARLAAEKRRVAELRRFDLCRYVSSIQRRKGLVLAEVSVAALCSLRAFYAQASFAIGDAANAAHNEQTEIAKACDRERAPWDLKMQRLQRILNQREVDHNLFATQKDQSATVAADETASKSTALIHELLEQAEEAHRVYAIDNDLNALYEDHRRTTTKKKKIILEGYLFSQPISSSGRRGAPASNTNWTRRWFSLDDTSLTAQRMASSWGGQLLRGVLARELSTAATPEDGIADYYPNSEFSSPTSKDVLNQDAEANAAATESDDEEVVAELLLSSVRLSSEDRCTFLVHSARGTAYKLQALGNEDCERWVKAIKDGVEKQLQGPSNRTSTEKKNNDLPNSIHTTTGYNSSITNTNDIVAGSVSSLHLLEKDHETARLAEAEECSRLIAHIENTNLHCADCDANKPEWVSINLGLVVCLRCSGVHRSLGTHLSKVRSLKLDRLSPLELLLIAQLGNHKANAVFEARLFDQQLKCTPESDAQTRAHFIRAKYRDRAYLDPLSSTANTSSELLLEAALSNNLQAALTAIILPDTNLDHPNPKGLTPLHLAAQSVYPAFCQLLILNGASIAAQDQSGHTPLDLFISQQNITKSTKDDDDKVLISQQDDDHKRHLALLTRLLSPAAVDSTTSPGGAASPAGSANSLYSPH